MSYIYRVDRPCYIIEDDRHFDPECGHFFSMADAYRELARCLIYTRVSDRVRGKYELPDAVREPESFDIAWKKLMRLELRLARWLGWCDSRNGIDTKDATVQLSIELRLWGSQ